MKILICILAVLAMMPKAMAAQPEILSAYLGAFNAPGAILGNVSKCSQKLADDGLVLVLSVQIDQSTLSTDRFRVVSKNGVETIPTCATIEPAVEDNELHTILLAGPIATLRDKPVQVKIVGPVRDINGNDLTGLVSPKVDIGLKTGPSLVHAFLFNKANGPSGSSPRAVQMVWQGGVSGRTGSEYGRKQLQATHIIDCYGNSHRPLGFDDDDGDNYVEIFIPDSVVANRIKVNPRSYFDPYLQRNPLTVMQVTSLLPAAVVTSIQTNTPSAGTNRVSFVGTPGIPHRVFFNTENTTDPKQWECIGDAVADTVTGKFSFDHPIKSGQIGFYNSTP